MGKIKGWKKWTDNSYIADDSKIISYNKNIDIRNNKPIWYVIIGIDIQSTKRLSSHSTKKEAKNFMSNYMRSHPNG
jgi:hypothetical protein